VPSAPRKICPRCGTSLVENTMCRTTLLGLAIMTAALALDTAPANAQYRYQLAPWCAQYNLPGGPMSCNFATLEQCRAEISGVGGMCNVNPYLANGPTQFYASKLRLRRSARRHRRR
jgi:Protein of unknown function (DUF3551)